MKHIIIKLIIIAIKGPTQDLHYSEQLLNKTPVHHSVKRYFDTLCQSPFLMLHIRFDGFKEILMQCNTSNSC